MRRGACDPESALTDLLFEAAGAGLCLVAPDGAVLRANAEWLRSTGRRLEEVIGRDVVALLPDSRDATAALHARARAGRRVEVPRHARVVDGRETWWEGSIAPVPMAGGTGLLIATREVARDLGDAAGRAVVEAEHRATETALRDSEARYRLLFQNMLDGFAYCRMIFDGDGRPLDFVYLAVNGAFERLTGLRDVVGRTVSEVIPGIREAHPELFETYGRVARTGHPERFELEFRPLGIWLSIAVYGPEPDHFVAVFDNISERKRVEEELRSGEARHRALLVETQRHAAQLDAVFESMADGLIVCGKGGEIVRSNAAVEQLLGISAPSLRAPVAERIRVAKIRTAEGGVLAPEQSANQRALRGEVVRGMTEVVERGDGTKLWLSVSAAPIREQGEIVGAVVSFTDRTDERNAAEALREADRRKDEFLGMLSHELRNPLAPIRNSTYILRHAEPGSDQARRAQAIIERQAEHLTRLVDDLLDVTRIARGKIELRRSRVDLREVVLRAADDFRLMMDDRGVAFRTTLPEAEVWADVDATRVTQIVGNLLHNAAKFTRRGDEVALSLSVAEGSTEIRVRDTGAGIDAALLPRVFEAFVQGERTLARTEGGLGLGLALVKGITELHGGTVRAHSAGKGSGSEFVVTLPIVAAARVGDAARGGDRRSGGGRRVLVVDDNRDAAESLADIVAMLGHVVEVAYDGPTAIAMARANPPEVVLCDIGLPGMSGYDVARTLRAAAAGIQLFAVSGYAQPEDVASAVEAGFDGHVAKPVDPERIARLLA